MVEKQKEKIVEHNIGYLFFIVIPVITFILYLISENLLLITLIGGVMVILLSLYIYRSASRKERLNIIRDQETLYFNLSDDLLFSVKLTEEKQLNEVLIETIHKEMATIKEIVDRIDFINFKNDKLNQELNALIK
jgi:hypothetical protein